MSANQERNQEATIYMGNLDERITEALIWELMVQAGPVVNVHLPKDRVTMQHQGYGFCEFASEDDADYAIKIMSMIKLYGKPLRVNKASSDKRQIEVGATLFIGNLDPEVDEKTLFEAFSSFGIVVQNPKIARDPETGASKGYAFIGYESFESSDAALEAMNGQYLMNRPLSVSYAFKKDGKGERHGSAAERLLASQAKKNHGVSSREFHHSTPGTGSLSGYPTAPPVLNHTPHPTYSSMPPSYSVPSHPHPHSYSHPHRPPHLNHLGVGNNYMH